MLKVVGNIRCKAPHARLSRIGLVTVAVASCLSSAMSSAASWRFGDFNIELDSTFTLATSIRAEERDFNLIGKNQQAQFDWSGYHPAFNRIYAPSDVWSLSEGGSYSANGDLGDLSFDKGDAFSTQISGSHEFQVSTDDYGFFARAIYFYDFALSDEKLDYRRPISGQAAEPCATAEAEEQLCQDIRLLDAFVYRDFYINDMPVSLRLGDQVVSWGESTFISHGINTTNPVDITRARTPGAELKEVFIPVGMLYASIGVNMNLSIDAYYQYDWERSLLPVSGSYFATNDFAGDGGQQNLIQLGFTGNPDIGLDTLLAQLNGIGDQLRSGADAAQLGQAYLAFPTSVVLRAMDNGDAPAGVEGAHKSASDDGQYGLRVTYFAENIETELSGYLINYHSTRPLISGRTADFSKISQDLGFIATNQITSANVTNLQSFAEAQFFYPEDITLYGFSFNTNVGETAVAGEISYRQDEPLQLDDVEILYAAMPEQLANAGLRPDLAGISQLNNVFGAIGPGEIAEGFIRSDTLQAQTTISHIFGPALGTDNLVLLGEVGYVEILDFPGDDVVRLNSPGTVRSGGIEPLNGNPRTGLLQALSDGPETNPFATDSAWGYRLLAVADFNNVYAGFNLRARATFSHDVDGTTPDPLFLFLEDSKSANVSFTLDYLSKWSATASYSTFYGGVGTTNGLADRDFFSFNIKYSI